MTNGLDEKIRIEFETFISGNAFKQFMTSYNEMSSKMTDFSNSFSKKMSDGFSSMADNIIGDNKRQQKYWDDYMKSYEKGGKTVRKVSEQFTRFRMELLGTAFFGQMAAKSFKEMLTPATELLGVNELLSITLQSVFLPIMESLMPIIISISEWFLNLSDSTKLTIGRFVLLGLAAATILSIGSFLLLGLNSLLDMIDNIGDIVNNLIPDLSIFGINLSSIAEAGTTASIVLGGFSILESIFGALKDAADKWGITDKLKEWGNSILPVVKEKFQDLFPVFKDLEEQGKSIWDVIKEKIDDLGLTEIMTSFEDIGGSFTDMWNTMKPDMEDIIDSLKEIAELAKTINSIVDISKAANEYLQYVPGTGAFTKNLLSGGFELSGTQTTSSNNVYVTNQFTGFTNQELLDTISREMKSQYFDIISSSTGG